MQNLEDWLKTYLNGNSTNIGTLVINANTLEKIKLNDNFFISTKEEDTNNPNCDVAIKYQIDSSKFSFLYTDKMILNEFKKNLPALVEKITNTLKVEGKYVLKYPLEFEVIT